MSVKENHMPISGLKLYLTNICKLWCYGFSPLLCVVFECFNKDSTVYELMLHLLERSRGD